MEKVIFVCLLSLAVGFSKPANENGPNAVNLTNATSQQGSVSQQIPSASPPAPLQEAATQKPDLGAKGTAASTTLLTNGTATNAPTVTPAPASLQPNSSVVISTTKPAESNSNTSSTQNNETTKATPIVPDNSKPATNSSDNIKPTDKSGQVTESTAKSSTTVKPTDDAAKADAKVQSRSFDGPSFIGGIILTLGLIAVGFIGFKYYKAKLNGNYRAF